MNNEYQVLNSEYPIAKGGMVVKAVHCPAHSSVIRYSLFTIRYLALFIHCSFFIVHFAKAQPGVWHSHPSFLSTQTVAAVQNKIYCASENGFFYYDPTANEATRLSHDDGFSESGISQLFYLSDQKRLLIGYRSGTIDLLSVTDSGEPGNITTITLIRDATQIQGSKRINHLTRTGNDAYLACDFGIVVLDVARGEVRDTYRNLGPNGTPVTVFSTALANDSIYASTSRGLLAARFAPTVNLAFFGNWKTVSLPPGTSVQSVVGVANRLYAAIPGQGVAERQGGRWAVVKSLPTITGLLATATEWIATALDQLQRASGVLLQNAVLGEPKEITEAVGSFWVADSLSGLLRITGTVVQAVSPDGPASDVFQRLAVGQSGQVLALPGGFTDDLKPLRRRRGFDQFRNGRWQNFLASSLPTDFVTAAYNPTDQRTYLGSFGGGLWSFDNQNLPEVVNRTVATISSLAVDPNGEIWLATPSLALGQATVQVRRKTGPFQSFAPSRGDIHQLIIDDSGFLWMRLSAYNGGGMQVFDPKTNRTRLLYNQSGEGDLPDRNVRSLVKDRDGLIWVGTDNGMAVFDNPSAVFTGSVNAYRPVFDRRRLLSGESVTALVVDGGNRKWIGTMNGLYLFNEDGTVLINTFTADNSPLPSSQITDIAIEPTTGEVFIATPNGLVSYGGTASEPAPVFAGITVFPNPVRPDFGGLVSIRGLVENTVVKIMDAGGQLVFETRSQGGTATWNLRDYRGRAAETGVYFVFAVAPDGREGVAGKLAVVR
ncbi:type IX secretion system anionic LPS delivery protein PorZ [Larkinella rosea]|uniref:Transcriptional regulator n=1 Tax=Larkinella rosea TaxID=2025312 RepID=A0A3P1BEA7_9BACT|nr:two-component regulator propeller domain-containing protein [Larkinella rosea]RRA98883.1 transcriptional regulator [Larkinella rosea]